MKASPGNAQRAPDSADARSPLRRLITLAWLDHAIAKSGSTEAAFAKALVYRNRTRSNLVSKWRSGQTCVSRRSALQVERAIAGTLLVFDALTLLRDRPMGEAQIDRLLEPFRQPYEARRKTRSGAERFSTVFDSTTCLEAGGFESLIRILGLVRLAEARRKDLVRMECCKDLVRAMPLALKVPWIAPHEGLLIRCVERLRRRSVLSSILFDVDWNVVHRLVGNPDYDPLSALWTAPGSVNNPILEAHLIPGKTWKELKSIPESRVDLRAWVDAASAE